MTTETRTAEELAASWEREADELQADYDRGEFGKRSALSVLRSCAMELREYGPAATQDQADEAIRLLRLVAPERPMEQDEQGGCVWCGAGEVGDDISNPTRHYNDCEWRQARAFLDRRETPDA